MKVTREPFTLAAIHYLEIDDADIVSWNPRLGPLHHQVTKLVTSLFEFEEEDLITLLRKNIDMFAWAPLDMSGIDTRMVCHRLAIDAFVKLVSQRKHKVGTEKRVGIDKEVQNLTSVSFITKIKYPLWLGNIVFVRKALNRVAYVS